jgi:hypothetical protein
VLHRLPPDHGTDTRGITTDYNWGKTHRQGWLENSPLRILQRTDVRQFYAMPGYPTEEEEESLQVETCYPTKKKKCYTR